MKLDWISIIALVVMFSSASFLAGYFYKENIVGCDNDYQIDFNLELNISNLTESEDCNCFIINNYSLEPFDINLTNFSSNF